MKNKMDERVELKRCPFCGDKLILQLVGHFTHAANYKVNCPIEGHHVRTDSDVVAWNRRTPESGSENSIDNKQRQVINPNCSECNHNQVCPIWGIRRNSGMDVQVNVCVYYSG